MKRDYTERLKHFLLSFSLSLSVSHERQPTEVFSPWLGVLIYGSSQLPCLPLTGRADTCQRTGDPRSQRGLWAGTQGKPRKGDFSFWAFFHLNRLNLRPQMRGGVTDVSGLWCGLHVCLNAQVCFVSVRPS